MNPKIAARNNLKKKLRKEHPYLSLTELRSLVMKTWRSMSDVEKDEYYDDELAKSTYLNIDRDIHFSASMTGTDYEWLNNQLKGRGYSEFVVPMYSSDAEWEVSAQNIRSILKQIPKMNIDHMSDDVLLKNYILNIDRMRERLSYRLTKEVIAEDEFCFTEFCVQNKLLIDSMNAVKIVTRFVKSIYVKYGLFNSFIRNVINYSLVSAFSLNTEYLDQCRELFISIFVNRGQTKQFKGCIAILKLLTPEQRAELFDC